MSIKTRRTAATEYLLYAFVAVIFALTIAAPASAFADRARSAPDTAAGYERMFAKVIADGEWGGGDVSLSVPIPDGRVVWLYGDTFSPRNGLVRSSAIVQTGGALHVSDHGGQVLPDDRTRAGRKSIYWIEAAAVVGHRTLDVTAAPMSIGTANGWDFHRRDTRSRVARVKVTRTGDVRFVRWTGWTTAPAPFADFAADGSHLTYEHRAHPWAWLADGSTLMTHANNWDLDGVFKTTRRGDIDYRAYAPTFYPGDGVERRAW